MVFKIKKQRSLARRMFFAVMAIAIAAQPIYGVISHELAANAVDGAQSVVINEVKPATGSGEKWIELYNPTDKSADLSGWRIVRGGKNWGGNDIATTIPAGGFYTVDAKANSDSLPTSTGTAVELWSGTEKKGSRVDSVTYPTLAEGQSYGRTTDGTDSWKTFDTPTKNATNAAKDETPTEPTTPATPTDPPVAPTILAPANNSYTNSPAFVTQWKDNAPAGGSYEYKTTYVKTDGSTGSFSDSSRLGENSGNYSVANGIVTRSNNQYSPEGTYSWQVRTVAADGTASDWSPVYKVTLDKTVPSISLPSPQAGQYLSNEGTNYNGEIVIKGHDDTQVAKISFSIDGGQEYSQIFASKDVTLTKSVKDLGLADGFHTLSATITDEAGNSWTIRGNQFYVDNSFPVLTVGGVKDGDFVHGTVPISLKINDQNPSVMYITAIGADGSRHDITNTNTAVTDFAKDWNTSKLPDGKYTLRFEAKDLAGNDTKKDLSVTVDNTAPTIKNITIERAITNQNQITIKGTVTDSNLKDYNLRVYKADKSGQVSPGIYYTGTTGVTNGVLGTLDVSSLKDGQYWVRIWADDPAGNRTGIASQIFVPFTVDRTAPTITVKSNYIGNLDKKIFSNVSFALSDAGNGKVDKYVINGYTSDFTNNKYSDANFQNIKSHLVEGKNTLVLYDEAGNSTEYDFTYSKTASVLAEPFNSFSTMYGSPSDTNFGLSDHSVEWGEYNDPNALWHGAANTEWYIVYESTDGWTTTNGQVPGKTVIYVNTFTTGETIPQPTTEELDLNPGQSASFWVHLVPVSNSFDPKVGEPYPVDAAYTRAWQKVTLSAEKDTTGDNSSNNNGESGSNSGNNNGTANSNNNNNSADSVNASTVARNLSANAANGRLIAYTPKNFGTILPSNAAALAPNPTTATPTPTATDATPIVNPADESTKTSTADDGNGQVLGAKDAKKWSVLNLALAILTAIIALGALATWSRRDKFASRRNLVTLATVIPAIGAVVAFLITENWTLKPTIFDAWTWLMAVIFVAQIVLVAARGRKANEE